MTEYGPMECRVHPDGGFYLVDILVLLKMAKSKNEARRLIEQGAVRVRTDG